MPPDLTPRDGAKMPPKPEALPNDQKAVMDEIEKLAGDQANATTAMASGALRSADANEESADVLNDIRDILVKVCDHFGVPLPARLVKAKENGEYDPDDLMDDEEDAEDGETTP